MERFLKKFVWLLKVKDLIIDHSASLRLRYYAGSQQTVEIVFT